MRRACLFEGVVGLWSLRDRYGAPKADRGTSLGSVRASDIVQPSSSYQQEAWGLDYSECTRPGGAHVGNRCSSLQRPMGREGVVTRRLKVRPHHLHAPQTDIAPILRAVGMPIWPY